MSFFNRLREGLSKTKRGFVDKVTELITGYKRIDDEFFEQLEEVFLGADIGVKTTIELIDKIKTKVYEQKISDMDEVYRIIQEELVFLLETDENEINMSQNKPTVILVVGVNGAGKTTTIGKLAYSFKEKGSSVLLAAGDTFRAAAIEQLEIWAKRTGASIVKHHEGSDAAAVAFDAVQAGVARKLDVILIDTAGRLHNKVNLMNELGKVKRVVSKSKEDAPNEILLVLDATTGQNALSQAKIFKEVVDVTGIVLTKLDGTAKGGMIFSIKSELGIPIKYIGVGEKIDDLKPFDSKEFVKALFDTQISF